MQVTRKIAAAAAVATVATLGLATVVSANVLDGATKGADLADAASVASAKGYAGKLYWIKKSGSLVAIEGNAIGPVQACDNFVPVNGVGGQVVAHDIVGLIGVDQKGNQATAVKTCETDSKNNGKWYRASNGIISVSDNAVGPVQACHNTVPVNGVGGQVVADGLNGLLGLGQHANSVDSLSTCELESENN
ncbi:hypothetical protein HPO96_15230 [Kribbella sandramycini]|uniref:Streptogrisin C n=1 Tax=Kribbella sandramycini TaxID=60450 RepID=A0A7Y4P067_9ACTN|nr:hypothetical protein [Kribbella sandramycini]MBB6565329.1 hypothetical protein [Kribbella sandramycini]NOL41598.1 hypothetical protein [Kribbella sandramycini]